MNTPKRSKGMLAFYVTTGAVVLLVVLGALNWKTFHLIYCKHLLRSGTPTEELDGVHGVVDVHLRKGMSQDEVAGLLLPLKARALPDDPTTFRLLLSRENTPYSEHTGVQISLEGDKYVVARVEF